MPAIASLDSRKYRGAKLWLVPFVRLKRALKGTAEATIASYIATIAKLAPENMLLNAIPGVCRANKKLAKPIYARTLAYGIY